MRKGEPIQPISSLSRPISLNRRTNRRVVVLGTITTAAGLSLGAVPLLFRSPDPALAQPPRPKPEPKPTKPPPDMTKSPHYGRPIEFGPDGSVAFAENETIVEVTLDTGEKIHAVRVLGPTFESTIHLFGTNKVNIGNLAPKQNDQTIFGGEYLRRVTPQGEIITDATGTPIDIEGRNARVDTPPQP